MDILSNIIYEKLCTRVYRPDYHMSNHMDNNGETLYLVRTKHPLKKVSVSEAHDYQKGNPIKTT